jgi:hypothetical protein
MTLADFLHHAQDAERLVSAVWLAANNCSVTSAASESAA